jgi:hypothetical protein
MLAIRVVTLYGSEDGGSMFLRNFGACRPHDRQLGARLRHVLSYYKVYELSR